MVVLSTPESEMRATDDPELVESDDDDDGPDSGVVETVDEYENTLDDPPVMTEPEESEVASQDTSTPTQSVDIGERYLSEEYCLVRMAIRSNGRALLCGCKASECTRRRHHLIRNDPTKRGPPGYYVTTWNANQTIQDLLEDTFRSVEQHDEYRARNQAMLAREAQAVIQASEQKEQTEQEVTERLPNSVGFALDVEAPPARASTPAPTGTTPRQDQLNMWRTGLYPLTPHHNTATAAATNLPGSVPLRTQMQPNLSIRENRGTTGATGPGISGQVNTTDTTALMTILNNMMDRFQELEATVKSNQQLWRQHLSQQNANTSGNGTTSIQGPEAPPIGQPAGAASNPVSPIPAVIHPTAPSDNSPNRWYAVSIGRTMGIFTSWRRVCESVKGYSGAKYKRFHNEQSARTWLQEQWAQPQRLSGHTEQSWDEVSFDGTQIEPVGTPIPTNPPPAGGYRTIANPALPHHDASVGESTKLYDTSIEVESEVLKLLCPKGVTDRVKRDLVETAVDVVALPGKYTQASGNDTPTVVDQLSEALGDLANYQAKRSGQRPMRDSQWRTPSRNGLKYIQSFDGLTKAADKLSSQSHAVIKNMTMGIKDILYEAGWSAEDSEIYCSNGILTRIVRDSLTKYHQLYVFFQSIAIKNPDRWDEVTAFYIAHHNEKLSDIRQFTPSYAHLVVQNYIYLRDAAATGFKHLDIVTAITNAMDERLTTPPTPNAGRPHPTYTCAHCHGSFHEGGRRGCPMAELKARVARRIAAEYAQVVPPDPAALERLIEAARREE